MSDGLDGVRAICANVPRISGDLVPPEVQEATKDLPTRERLRAHAAAMGPAQKAEMVARVLDFIDLDWPPDDPCEDPSSCFWMEGERAEGESCEECGVAADGRGGFYPPTDPAEDISDEDVERILTRVRAAVDGGSATPTRSEV